MKKRRLINVKMKDGSIKPILDVNADDIDDEMELVETDNGFEIRLKENRSIEKKDFGLKE